MLPVLSSRLGPDRWGMILLLIFKVSGKLSKQCV